MGQLRSSVNLVSKTKKVSFQIHHIALSANALFRLTLPRTHSYGQNPISIELNPNDMLRKLCGRYAFLGHFAHTKRYDLGLGLLVSLGFVPGVTLSIRSVHLT